MRADPSQLSNALEQSSLQNSNKSFPTIARDLNELVDAGCTFSTVYADSPWPYGNDTSRAAAVNHFPTMALDDICYKPVARLSVPREKTLPYPCPCCQRYVPVEITADFCYNICHRLQIQTY